jgi:hypothetical protein
MMFWPALKKEASIQQPQKFPQPPKALWQTTTRSRSRQISISSNADLPFHHLLEQQLILWILSSQGASRGLRMMRNSREEVIGLFLDSMIAMTFTLDDIKSTIKVSAYSVQSRGETPRLVVNDMVENGERMYNHTSRKTVKDYEIHEMNIVCSLPVEFLNAKKLITFQDRLRDFVFVAKDLRQKTVCGRHLPPVLINKVSLKQSSSFPARVRKAA